MDAVGPRARAAADDEHGQAVVLAVLLIAIAALVITGLRGAEVQILRLASARSAGEAAVEAASAVVADAYAGEMGARVLRPPRDMVAVLTDAAVRERARAAADDLSARNGGSAVEAVTVTCANGAIDVSASLASTWFRARFSGPECSPR